LLSVASCTTRRAFWLLSSGTHLCASNAALTSASAACPDLSEPNSELHRSHTPSMDGVFFTMRSLRFGISQVYRYAGHLFRPVDFKRHHYRPA
jgi:hypothetical protein